MPIHGRAGGHRPTDGIAWPPPASPPRPVPYRPPRSAGILHRAAMAFPHQAAPALHRPSASAFPPRRSRPSVAGEALRKLLFVPRAALPPPPAAAAASASAPPSSAAPAGQVFSATAPAPASVLHAAADKVLGGSSMSTALQHRGAYGTPLASSTPPRATATMPLPDRVLNRPPASTPPRATATMPLPDRVLNRPPTSTPPRATATMPLPHRVLNRPPACLLRPSDPTICVVNSAPDDVDSSNMPIYFGQDNSYKMTGITPIPVSQLIFPVDDKGTRVSTVQYFGDSNGLQYGSSPRFRTKEVDRHGNNLLTATYIPCQEGELNICDVILPGKTAEDKSSHELERNVCRDSVRTVAAHSLPPPMVNVDFCGFKIRVPAVGATVLDLVWLALLKQNITVQVQDFYLRLNSKMIDGSVLVNSIPNLDESIICVCPRLRGGAPIEQPLYYVSLDVIINNNAGQLFSTLQIPQGMVDPGCQYGDVAIFWSELPQFFIHQLLLLVCLEGHFQNHCYHGAFDLSRVLMSSSGHMKFSDDVYEHEDDYTVEGGDLDYRRLYAIVLMLADVTADRVPTHVASLLWVLRNAPKHLRQKREFIAFVVNHPSLLTFAEKQMLYILVDAFLYTLLNTRCSDPNDRPQITALKSWLQGTRIEGWSDWERTVQKVTVFKQTYWRGAKRSKGAPANSPKVSIYKAGADQCIHLGRNFLSHKYKVGLKLVEAALSYLLEFLLPLVLYNLAKCLSGSNGKTFISIVSNPRADRTTVTGYWSDGDDAN